MKTRLWNQYPDNLDACSAPERDFLPQMDEYFSDALEQLDPASGKYFENTPGLE